MMRSRMLDMSRSTRRVAACAAFGALALSLSACGSTKSATTGAANPPTVAATTPSTADPSLAPAPDATPTTSGAVYVAFSAMVPADNWDITQAARRDDPKSAGDLDSDVPGLDWSAQYQDGSVQDETKAPYVMVSGFSAKFEDVSGDVAADDAQQKGAGDINGHRAVWGMNPADTDTNTYVVYEQSPGHTVELDGANLTLDQLRAYATALQPVSEQDWVQVHANADDGSDSTESPVPTD